MYPIADLTAFCRRTTGDVPPKLVGASTTIVGSKLYLYGGRLVAERRMVSDIYMFDLETFKWDKMNQPSSDDVPQARYFHSADSWNNHLIIFGGMAIQPHSDNPEDLCVLNDVRLFDLTTHGWLPSGESSPAPFIPKARYAHLSSVTSNRLFIIGGQDLNNVWLDDIHVYDLALRRWVQRRDYPRHCGTYRSVAVTADKRVRLPQDEGRSAQSLKLGTPGARFSVEGTPPSAAEATQPDALVHLPYSAPPTDDYPCDIYLFSNYNFTDVQRELEAFSPLPNSDFTISDRSSAMTGTAFPPGLRFPTGAILGTHFIIAGTYLSQTFQSFSVWTLDLVSMTWSRIDPGSALAGSWFRSCLWPEANKFLIFGNRHGNLVEDYNRRLLSWDHVAVIDLEAFGIYQPPPLLLDIPMQELGLAALEEGVLADFEVICDDGRKIPVSRKLLEDRWPWFKEQRKLFIQAATRALETIPSTSTPPPLPDLPAGSEQEPRPDPRLTPRAFQLSEPYPVSLALMQYFYSMAIITPLQHAPAVLSQLLLLSSTYNLPHLQSLVKHAMHRALTFATSVGIYGVSTLCNCRSLQIRALRVVMAYSQKRPTGNRSRGDRDGANGAGGRFLQPPHGDGSRGGSSSDRTSTAARPRGMSDASYLRGPSDSAGGSTGRGFANGHAPPPIDIQAALAQLWATRPRGLSDVSHVVHRAADSIESGRTVTNPRDDDIVTPLPSQSQIRSRTRSLTSRSPPPATYLHRKSNVRHGVQRRASIVSLKTEEDIQAVAEMMDFVDIGDTSLGSERQIPIPDDGDSDIDNFDDLERPDSSYVGSSSPSSSSYPTSPASFSSSMSNYFETDPIIGEYCDTAHLSPPQSPFPAFHLPSPKTHISWDNLSDLPSLRSSASNSSLSTASVSRPPSMQYHLNVSSAGSYLPTPTDTSPRVQPLTVIEEVRHPEESGPGRIQYPIHPGNRSFVPPLKEGTDQATVRARDRLGDRRGLPETLKIETTDTVTIKQAPRSPAPSSGGDSSSSHSHRTPGGGGGGGAFSRLFHMNSNDSKKLHKTLSHTKSNDSIEHAHPGESVLDISLSKAEEKKRKKEIAKHRTEQLAIELKEKAKKRAAEAAAARAARGPKKASVWEEEGGMWGGGRGFTL